MLAISQLIAAEVWLAARVVVVVEAVVDPMLMRHDLSIDLIYCTALG